MGFDLENAVKEWKRSWSATGSVWPGELDELEAHLLDVIDQLTNRGWSVESAFQHAVDSLGNPEEISQAFREEHYAPTPKGALARLRDQFFPALLVNYLISTSRSIRRAGIHSLIASGGLAIALACCMWIMVFAGGELGYDSFHDRSADLVRLTNGSTANTPEMWADVAISDVAGVEDVVRVRNEGFSQVMFSVDGIVLPESNGISVDAKFLDVFGWTLSIGNKDTALDRPWSIVISPEMIERYDLPANPIGSIIDISGLSNTPKRASYTVTGVLKPENELSHIDFDYLLSFETILLLEEQGRWGTPFSWTNRTLKTYLLLSPAVDRSTLAERIQDALRRSIPDKRYSLEEIELQPVRSIHLHSTKRSEFPGGGNWKFVWLLGGLAVSILLLALVNFINLTTSRSMQRAKEVGMRKALGASSHQIRSQYLSESLILTIVSMGLALIIAWFMQDFVRDLTQKDLSLSWLFQPVHVLLLIGLTVVTAILAGYYPAMVLSRYQSVEAMKPNGASGLRMTRFRKSLVVFQLVVSMGLIAVTQIMHSQMDFVSERDLGYKPENVFVVNFGHSTPFVDGIDRVLSALRSDSRFTSVSASHSLPTGFLNSFSYFAEGAGPDDDVQMGNLALDAHLAQTLQLEIIAGRTFEPDQASDSLAFVLNESAARALGWNPDASAIGKVLDWPMGSMGFSAPVIGIVKDFHYGSLKQSIRPIVFNLSRFGSFYLLVRISPTHQTEALADLASLWKEIEPDYPFNAIPMKDRLEAQYEQERRMTRLFSASSFLALIIAALGLFSLSAFSTKQRMREIGIRKAMGAGTPTIVISFVKEFGYLLLVAVPPSILASYLIMQQWLSNFAYRVSPGWYPFVWAVATAAVVTLGSVLTQSWKAARTSPVRTLRAE